MSRTIFTSRFTLTATLSLSALLAPLLGACGQDKPIAMSGPNTVVAGKAAIGGAYSLVDHHGNAVTEADFVGRPQLIYFGFAFCPDICPTALQQMAFAIEIATEADKSIDGHYQTMLITVDPERDTPEKLALYVSANGFPKNLVGLTGSQEQINAVKKVFAAIGNKVPDPSSAAGYTYDHSSIIYLMDKEGEFVDLFSHNDTPQDIAKRLVAYKKTGR